MSSIERPLSGDALIFHLDEERKTVEDLEILGRSGRNARTLFKQGALRATLIVLAPGGELAEHHTPGPIMVQPIRGHIRFSMGAEEHDLGPGDLLTVGPDVPHSVSSERGGAFLLTVSHTESSEPSERE